MNSKILYTTLMALLATLFLVSSTTAGIQDGINLDNEIQEFGMANALSNEPYDFPSEVVKFETSIKKETSNGINSLGAEIQVLGLANAVTPEHNVFINHEAGNALAAEYGEYCSEERLVELEDPTISLGGDVQVLGMYNALNSKC